MAVLSRMDWYDLARTTNWTPPTSSEDELFPPMLSRANSGLPLSAWEYDEPLQADLPQAIEGCSAKDAGAYSVKAALERSRIFENADARAVMKGPLRRHRPRQEYAAASAEARG